MTTRPYVLSECRELDGCCLTHGPCFTCEDPDVPDVSVCQGWPCPDSQNTPAA